MLETLVCLFFLSVLANWQAVETYHHSQLFEPMRAYMEARGGFWADATACPYCLSHWTAFLFTTLSLVLACGVHAAPLDWWLAWPAFSLAVTRSSNVLNDLTHPYCRTPNTDETKISPIIADLEKLRDRPF